MTHVIAPLTRQASDYDIARSTHTGSGQAVDLWTGMRFFFKPRKLSAVYILWPTPP
jgi:hypothetical protein